MKHANRQDPRALLFSSVVDLMGVVVSKIAPSVHAAYQEVAGSLPVSITSVYNKLNKLEPCVTSAFVRHTACRLAPVILEMGRQIPALLPGYRVQIIDGNHLAATERRLHVLLRSKKRRPRGAKKPVPKRTQHVDSPHVSTARLLAKSRGK